MQHLSPEQYLRPEQQQLQLMSVFLRIPADPCNYLQKRHVISTAIMHADHAVPDAHLYT